MRASREEGDEFEVPMTPLIDVVFLLLIFFLVATNFTRKEIDNKVDLPNVEGGVTKKKLPQVLILNIRADGTVVVNGEVIEKTALRDLVKRWHQKNPREYVAIRGDGKVPYETVMKIMGLCRAVGIERVDLPVEDLDAEGS